MIVTEKTPQALLTLLKFYKAQNSQGKAYLTIRDCIFHNNNPVNILKAVTALKDVEYFIELDQFHPVEMEYCLRYLGEVTGYGPVELNERLKIA